MKRCLWGTGLGGFAIVCLLGMPARAGEIINLYMAKADLMVVHIVETPIFISALLGQLSAPASYTITSTDDPSYASATSPSWVKQKRKQLYKEAFTQTTYSTAGELWFTLKLPAALQSRKTYTVTFADGISYSMGGSQRTFVFDEKEMYSEAIHVNNVGFLRDASMKYGYVSQYLGEAGGVVYSNSQPFHLVNTATNQTVFSGTLNERSGTDDYKVRVWECDFSSFSTAGEYKLVVEGVGCSYSFEISDDGYRRAYQAACRGMFHQRCGMAFTAEHTRWVKPRCHHSDDIPAYQTTSGFVNDDPEALKQKATSERIDCWGGWHDAGDFDHYGSHFKIPFMLYAAYEINPSGTGDNEMNIPESGNGVPDVIDEARWGVDLWRRMQKSDGRVPEYTTPYPSPSSLDDATAIYASVPTTEATLLYAGMAAGMGYFLNTFGKSSEASGYINSAKKAYAVGGCCKEKAMAALWLWRATGESSYHDAFKNNKPSYPAVWAESNALETYIIANYVFAQGADVSIVNSYKNAIVNRADSYMSDIDGDAMRVRKKGDWMGGYTLPSTMALALAYRLTGDKTYRDYMALECDYYLGGNPLNMTWLTGLGEKHPTDLLQVEAIRRFGPELGLPTPLGLVPYGPAATYHNQNWCAMNGTADKSCYPGSGNWSIAELWYEWPHIICNNEYTVHQMQGPAIFAYSAVCDDQMSSPWSAPVSVAGNTAPSEIVLPDRQPIALSRSADLLHVSTAAPACVEILDIAGRRIVRRAAAAEHAIELSSLARGSYIVKVRGDQLGSVTLLSVQR